MESSPTKLCRGGLQVKIVLDCAHGGSDSGARTSLGEFESHYSLEICKLVRHLLSPHMEVILTREDDTFVSLPYRCRLANDANCDLFLSLHTNSAMNKSAQGYEVFTSKGVTRSDELALKLASRHIEAFPAQVNRGIKEANFYVLKKTNCPAALVEFGFFSNSAEATWLLLDETKVRLAEAVASGVLDFCGITETGEPRLTTGERLDRIERKLGI